LSYTLSGHDLLGAQRTLLRAGMWSSGGWGWEALHMRLGLWGSEAGPGSGAGPGRFAV